MPFTCRSIWMLWIHATRRVLGHQYPPDLTQREAHLACEMVAETGKLIGMDIVEVNSILDIQNQTASLAVEYVLSALGKRIWNEN